MDSRLFLMGIGLLIPATALAQVDDGVCRDDVSPIAALELPSPPPTSIAMSHARVALCDAPPVFTFSADLNVAIGTFSIPLSSLRPAPMTTAQFADSIAKVDMPAPWGTGDVTWSVKDGALQISAPVDPNAWGPVEGHLGITLKSGQLVLVDVAAPSLIADDGANVRAGAQGSIVADLDMIQHDRDVIARANAEIANPTLIPFGGQAVLSDAQQHLAAVDAAIAAARPGDDLSALRASRESWATRVDSLSAEAALERTQRIADLQVGLGNLAKFLADDQARLAAAQKQLDDPTPHRRAVTTGYDAGCKSTETAKR